MTKQEWQAKFRTLKSQQYNEVKTRLICAGMSPWLAGINAYTKVYGKEGK